MTALILQEPRGARLPLVCDSPHSGTAYPDDFRTVQPMAALRQGEDTHIEALWDSAPAHGATLVAARFPRTYIDPNRELDDLDPALLDGPWPGPLNPGEKSRLGYGLVWSRLDAERPLYDRRLTVAEVQQRIQRCWQPYHAALNGAIERAVRDFGAVWHLNLHSMPNNAYEKLGRTSTRPLADFVLGDRDGTTCEPALMDVVERAVRDFGYSVARNDPYKGVALIARIGQPAAHRHSLQIEIRRPLYMDEATRQPHAGFEPLRRCLDATLAAVAAHVGTRLAALR
jgi:N-formylglutamate deformylase